MFSAAANEHAFKTLATALGDSLQRIADRLVMKEEQDDEEEGEEEEDSDEKEEDEEEEKEEEKKNKKNKTTHTAPDEIAKE